MLGLEQYSFLNQKPSGQKTPEDEVSESSLHIEKSLLKSNPQIKRPIDFKKYPTLSKSATELKKYLEDNSEQDQTVIGGSSAAYAQVRGFRRPKDLDLHTHKMLKVSREISTILAKKYGQKNIHVSPLKVISLGNEQTKIIQIKLVDSKGNLHDAVDVKSVSGADMPYMDFSLSTIKVIHKPVKIEKLYYEPIGQLISKKARAIRESYVKKINRGEEPSARTKKDILDFISMSESVPDFQKMSLKGHMDRFKNNLRYFDKIPKKEKETLKTIKQKDKEISDPFGLGSFL